MNNSDVNTILDMLNSLQQSIARIEGKLDAFIAERQRLVERGTNTISNIQGVLSGLLPRVIHPHASRFDDDGIALENIQDSDEEEP